MAPARAIFCNQIGNYPNCHQTDIIQQLMKADEKIHSQARAELQEFSWRKGWEIVWTKSVKVMINKSIETAGLSPWELMDSGSTARESTWD